MLVPLFAIVMSTLIDNQDYNVKACDGREFYLIHGVTETPFVCGNPNIYKHPPTGRVKLQFNVDDNGIPIKDSIQLLSNNPESYRLSAIKTIQKWRFNYRLKETGDRCFLVTLKVYENSSQ
ncbi:hypothetical protein L9G15_11090 [Shewanella sp. A3A]|nr:hypothetical protein [Shewanella ferrihydritica]